MPYFVVSNADRTTFDIFIGEYRVCSCYSEASANAMASVLNSETENLAASVEKLKVIIKIESVEPTDGFNIHPK